MIFDLADDLAGYVLLVGKVLVIGSSAGVGAVLLFAWVANTLEARRLRRWAEQNHAARQRAKAIASRRMTEARAIPRDRSHPLHTLGGRFR